MKERNLKKKVGSLLLAVAMIVTSFPAFSHEGYAAENQLPTKEQFATAEELKQFNTNDNDGEINPAKVYFGKDNQQWWIAGSQGGDCSTLFAASHIGALVFTSSFDSEREYSADWDCDYTSVGGSNPTKVYPNHYGASFLRIALKDLESSYFTSKEQDLMKDTTVYTQDTKNNSVYSTTNKLYPAYSDGVNKYITVGKNAPDSLNKGLRIDKAYWDGYGFWLRVPGRNAYYRGDVLLAMPGYFTISRVSYANVLVPAFELNLSSVIFASAAPAASSDGNLTLQDTDGDGAFTLRYDATKSSKNLGSALVSYDKSKVTLTDVPENTYLVVQNSSGAWAKKITNEKEVSAGTTGVDSFANCKVWLETTDSNARMTYATLATEAQGYGVNITAGEGVAVTNGTQVVGQGSAITDITVEVANGYYLPNGYTDTIQGLNGLNIKDTTQTGFTITGTPTSDVNITLPAATVLPKADTPEVTISKTATSITATVTNHKTEFGDIEYKWDNGDWKKDKKTLSNLQPNTTHTLAVRFTGNGFCQGSDEYSVDITTLNDGSTVIVAPSKLTTTYKEGLKLSDVQLPQGWSWENGDTSLSVGTKAYPATFDTASLESTTDFSNVEGYDPNTHKVTRNVTVEVRKADSVVTITTQSLDKAYDGNAVNAPEYTTSGSDGKVTIKWQEKSTTAKAEWKDLDTAPNKVGTYQVVVELAGNDNYKSASAVLGFVISKAQNTWTENLSITGWTYDAKANNPTAKAQFGDVTFSYSNEENGTYTSEVPKNAGTWYVKASVAGTENYTGLEAVASFEIAKAIPTYEKVTGLVLRQGQPLSKIELPEQFKWVDETMMADELGTHTFKAVYTPEDTANYQTIEVEIEVEVVPMQVELNHVPTISASNKTLIVGDKFDPLKDVTASGKEDGDLTPQIKVIKNTVNTKKAGTYEVTYQVTDSQGVAVTKTIKVTVEAKSTPVNLDKDKPDNDKDNGSVKTGDRNNLLLWEMMLIGSSIILIYSLYRKKRKTNQ